MKEVFKINDGWKFMREDLRKDKEHIEDYFDMFSQSAKTGVHDDERGNAFFDESWKSVSLPNDWCTMYDADAMSKDAGQGYKAQGVAWYRRHFTLNDIEGKRVFLKFDAIAITSAIWVNGIQVAKSNSGYIPIFTEITDFIEQGKQICVSVRTENTVKEGWWYEGGGIVGDAYLIISEESRFKEDGIFINGEKQSDKWKINIKAESEINDDGLIISAECAELGIKAEKSAQEITGFEFDAIPQVWDIENPKLYDFCVKLIKNDETIDEEWIKTGFRTVEFDSEKGCFLNGRHIKLNGVCIHHDFAGVGVVLTDDIQRYRIKRLKDMGCNSIRCSHNPHQTSLYRVCDEMGMLVIDESRHFSSTEEVLAQLERFIKRDRNFPCIILWSLFNEEPLQCTITGEKIFASMKKLVNRLDGTRLISGAMNGPMESEGVIKQVDLMGFNYIQYEYDEFHNTYPDIPIWGSENSSHLTTRGVTEYNKAERKCRCFTDVYGENTLAWSSNIGDTLKMSDTRDFVMGTMDWTGFDYRGESGAYPACVCNFGSMDLCGFAKDNFYWHKVIWEKRKQIYLSPRWKYADGKEVTIACYSNCDYVVIKQNGKVICEKEHNMYERITVNTVYHDGVITAEGYCGKDLVAVTQMKTYGEPYAIKLERQSESIVTVYTVDKDGNIVEDADNEIVFEVQGGEVLGVGNGDNCFKSAEMTNKVKLFYGKALAVIKEETKLVTVRAISEGLKSDEMILTFSDKHEKTIPAEKAKIYVPIWRQSDVFDSYIEEKFISDLMFAWIPTTVGYSTNLLYSGKTGFAEVCGQLSVPQNLCGTVYLTFEKIEGDFDLYMGKDLIGSYSDVENMKLVIDTKKYKNPIVSIIFKIKGGSCGVSGSVYLTNECC